MVKEAKFLVELVMPNELEVVQELEMELELELEPELEQELKLKLIQVQELEEEELELKVEPMIMPWVLITIKLVKIQKIAIRVSEPHFN